jgi:hypothetical protein
MAEEHLGERELAAYAEPRAGRMGSAAALVPSTGSSLANVYLGIRFVVLTLGISPSNPDDSAHPLGVNQVHHQGNVFAGLQHEISRVTSRDRVSFVVGDPD